MIVRILIGLVLLAAAGGAVAASGGDEGGKRYTVQLDNAFGIVDGGDVKVGGVRAGIVERLRLDQDQLYALIDIRIDEDGFGDLRKDVFCEARQQSLIGEYFLDCKPGTAKERLPEGATIPIAQTGSTVPVDLVQDISRRPVRERASIILSQLGAAFAGRGKDLNETIRRASPALREVNRVLAALREERRTIRDLYADADEVVGDLARSRTEVTRFLREARDTTGAQAAEAESLRRQFNKLPRFLRELRPTLASLGRAAAEQEPALRGLTANAARLRQLFGAVERFSSASRPAVRTLADAAEVGRPAVLAARPRIGELATAAKPLPELSKNAAITLEHLDDPRFASEKDVRAGRGPDGGYTGLEALLRYIHAQSQAINTFDEDSYFLKVSLFNDTACANYADEVTVKNEANARCRAWLGPNQPGITTPDPTPPRGSGAARPAAAAARDRKLAARAARADAERAATAQNPLLDYLLAP
jgi:virulence factor Mce-like protein